MKWNERSKEEQAAIKQAILAAVREADAKVQAIVERCPSDQKGGLT